MKTRKKKFVPKPKEIAPPYWARLIPKAAPESNEPSTMANDRWLIQGLDDWPTEAIFEKLRELGIDTDAERFPDQAAHAGSWKVLENAWVAGLNDRVNWDEFPYYAIEVLWPRLAHDVLSPETLAGRLDDFIQRPSDSESPSKSQIKDNIEAAMVLVNYLESFAPDERAARYREMDNTGVSDYPRWLTGVISKAGEDYLPEAIRIADTLGSADEDPGYQMELIALLARLGRREEVENRLKSLFERYPNDFRLFLNTGTVYMLLNDASAALDAYVEALRLSNNPVDWSFAKESILGVLEALNRTDEWAELESRFPRVTHWPSYYINKRDEDEDDSERDEDALLLRHPPTPYRASAPLYADEPYHAGRKTGPNDPCPCGSGKKYKKCCRK